MIGSLAVADFDLFTGVERLLLDAIIELGYRQSSVADFNDAPGRTVHQVLQVYDRAIERSVTVA